MQLKNEKISHEEKNHRLLWLNIKIGNIKNNITCNYWDISLNKQKRDAFIPE